jgi:phosphoesterase RecJ-like protein
MLQIDDLQPLLSEPRRIAITTHHKPDGDAMGSSMGLYHYLIKKGHRVDVVTPTDYGEFLKWLVDNDKVLIGSADADRANWIFEGADIIFCLDFNSLSRINEFEKSVRAAEGKKVMIDHHMEPEGFHDLAYWDDTASSTAEMIYRLIIAMGDGDLIDRPMAEALYMGVMTDTGSFRFTNTSPAVHRMVAHLIEAGVDVSAAHEAIYNNGSVERLQFLGHCFSECLSVYPEYETAYFKVTKDVFRKYNVRTGDTEGLVNFALGIKGINLGVLISEQDDMTKLSFRSRAGVSSQALAEQFGGGGHFYASGGRTKAKIDDTEQQLLSLLAAQHSETA